MKKRLSSARHAGLAILAGALSFMGSASAVTIFSEGFEGVAAANIFSAPTYAYSANYTLANGLSPAAGLRYMHGGAGTSGAASTNTFTATGSPFNIITGGITGAQVDSSGVLYNFAAQFSTYHEQNDFAEVEIRFLNAASTPIGSPLRLGSSALVTALAGGAGNRAWTSAQLTGTVPVGARSVSLVAFDTKTPNGTNIDGYMDNVSLNINPVPEPATGLSALLAGSVLAARRRRRQSK